MTQLYCRSPDDPTTATWSAEPLRFVETLDALATTPRQFPREAPDHAWAVTLAPDARILDLRSHDALMALRAVIGDTRDTLLTHPRLHDRRPTPDETATLTRNVETLFGRLDGLLPPAGFTGSGWISESDARETRVALETVARAMVAYGTDPESLGERGPSLEVMGDWLRDLGVDALRVPVLDAVPPGEPLRSELLTWRLLAETATDLGPLPAPTVPRTTTAAARPPIVPDARHP